MKKCVALCATLAALAWAGVAAADTPQGQLTSFAFFSGGDVASVGITVADGGTNYVGLENDLSGDCSGDAGEVTVNTLELTVVCAHYVAASADGSGPKMRFALSMPDGTYEVWRISDGGPSGPDKVLGHGKVATLAGATGWVDKGSNGCGCVQTAPWSLMTITSGGYTITP